MKPTFLWSLVALCGVVGGGVALHGGWRSVSLTLPPIRLTKVVWVTNDLDQPDPWTQPLKPEVVQTVILEHTPYSQELRWGREITNLIVPTNMIIWTNRYSQTVLTITNSTDKDVTVTIPTEWTNMVFSTNIYLNIGAYGKGWSATNRVDK